MKKIVIICLLLIVITGCKKIEERPKELEDNHGEKITQLLKDSYQYSLYALGDLTLSDAYVEINDKKYYHIENDDIKNINELNDLINKIYIEDSFNTAFEQLHSKKEFLVFDDKFVVSNNEDTCNIGTDYNFEVFEIINETEEELIMNFNQKEYKIYLKDGNYYLDDIIFKCLD